MNRRSFFKFLGAGAATLALSEAIPFGRVWSFPKTIVPAGSLVIPPGGSVRFVRAWDMYESRMISRLDMAYGFGGLELPAAVECAQVDHNTSDAPLIWHPPDHVPRELVAMVRAEQSSRGESQPYVFGAHGPIAHYLVPA